MRALLAVPVLAAGLLVPIPTYAAAPTCLGLAPTIVGTAGEDVVGTEGPDVVIATQMHPAAVASLAMRAHGLRAPAIGVLTDFGVHDFWIHPGIDRYCVATDAMAAALADAGVARSAVTIGGIPLMRGFRFPPAPAQARRALQVRSPQVYARRW